jgi:glucose/mannose-6-phosphate isomerase
MRKATILDELEEVKRIDKSDMLGHCMKTPEYCEDAIQLAKQTTIPSEVKISEEASIRYGKPRRVIIAGMGGSAIGGEMLRDWLRDELPLPIEVCRDYSLPAYADEDTLVFAVSHSGNTEETLNAFVDAIHRKCMTLTITSGGHLLSFSQKLQMPHVTIPTRLPPRVAIPYLFLPLPILMERMGILRNIEGDLEEVIQVLRRLSEENSPETPTENNPTKRLALELTGSIPVVYGFRQYGAIARRWKTQFNENSKVPSKCDVFPELNHNEVVGWEAPEALTKKFSIILIRDLDEPPEIRHRIEATKSLALHKAWEVLEIYARGEKKLARMFSLLYLGDLTSIYSAILRGIDPSPVEIIDKIKSEMGKRFNLVERLRAEVQKWLKDSS